MPLKAKNIGERANSLSGRKKIGNKKTGMVAKDLMQVDAKG